VSGARHELETCWPSERPSTGTEGYLTNPRFNRGVPVTLTPSATFIDMVFHELVFK